MTDVNIHAGEGFDALAARATAAWKKMEAGQPMHEEHVTFCDWEILTRVLTTRRFELLKYLYHHPQRNISGLARELHRDYKRVYEDVKALASAGLLFWEKARLYTPYQRIDSRISW